MNLRLLSGFLFLVCVLAVDAGAGILHGPVINPANGHAYYLLEADAWQNSVGQAYALGGHLVVINDQAENEWVATTFGRFGGVARNLWLGLSDAAKEGTFEWVNRDPVSFTRWKIGEPDNAQEGENYAFIVAPVEGETGGEWAISANVGDGGAVPFAGVVEADRHEQDSTADWAPFSPYRWGPWYFYSYNGITGASELLKNDITYTSPGIRIWKPKAAEAPNARVNFGNTPVGTPTLQPYELVVEPGAGGEYVESEWQAPTSGTFVLEATFLDIDRAGDGQDVHVLVDGAEVFSAVINAADGNGRAIYISPVPLRLAHGKSVILRVGNGGDGHNSLGDLTHIDANLRYLDATLTFGTELVDSGEDRRSDAEGNYFVVAQGSISKRAGADGRVLWERPYSPGFKGRTLHSQVDGQGNFVVLDTDTYDYFTLTKFSGVDGQLIWSHRDDNPYGTWSPPFTDSSIYSLNISFDAYDNIVVSGSVNGGGGYDADLYVAKYEARQGIRLWERRCRTSSDFDKWGRAAIDPDGSITVSGAVSRYYLPGVALNVVQIVRYKAPLIDDQYADLVSHTEAVLHGLVRFSDPQTKVYFEYGTDASYGMRTPKVPLPQDGQVSAAISGLSALNTYHFRLVAETPQGLLVGEDQVFDMKTVPNLAPVAQADFYTDPMPAGSSELVIDVLANDSDPDGDQLQIKSVSQGQYGAVSINEGKVIYRPAANLVVDSFNYTITDAYGGTALGWVEVGRYGVNATAAIDDFTQVVSGVSSAINVLANDSAPGGKPLSITSYTQGQHGTVTQGSTGRLYYMSTSGFAGDDQFTYTISDGLLSASATVRVTVSKPPVAVDDSGSTSSGLLEIDVLANDSDPGGKPLTIIGYTQPAHGAVEASTGEMLRYSPYPDFRGDDQFTYTISNGALTAQATVRVSVSAWPAAGNILAGSGTEVPGAGEAGGVPVGASFRSFGVPSINDQEKVAFTATFAAGKQSGSAVFAGSPLGLIAGKGSPAPDAVGQPLAKGEIFSSFRDPLLNARGDVAFLARISRATQRSDSGLWLKPAEGSLHMVLREGDAAAGLNGARWSTFVSVGLTDSRVIPFVATLQVGKGGVTPANALGLWTWKEGEAKLLLRKGDRISVGEKQKQVKSFAALAPANGSPGQGRLGTGEEVLVRVSWSDRTQSLVKVAPGIAPEVIASTGDKVTGTEMRFASFGIPSPDRQGGFAVRATLQPRSGGVKASSDTGVFKYAPDTGWTIIVQEGESRPDDPLEEYGQRMIPFYAITEAVSDAQGRVALLAAGGRGSSWPFDLWWTASAGLSLAHTWWSNATWTGPIVSFAYPDGENASLVYLVDAPNGTGKKAKREIGLWALDQDGLSRLLCKSGQTVSIRGVTKTIRDLDFLELVPGSPAQPRSYNSRGQIICRLIFTDGSQAVLKGSVR